MSKLTIIFLSIFILSNAITGIAQQPPEDNIEWQQMNRALHLASDNDKMILIDVFAEWCPYCQRMQSEVYPDTEVEEQISKYFIPVRINTESDQELIYKGNRFTEAEFATALRFRSVPTTYFMNAEGEIVGQQPGFLPVDVFVNLLEYVGSGAHETQSFEEFTSR